MTISGFAIPALTVRSAETTVELASGQSFALAGLLQRDTTQNLSKVPWLGDVPILGALFRSNKFQNDETELVIIVTPYLVRPPATALASPTDGFTAPHDAQQVLWGDTWRQRLPAPGRGPLDSGGERPDRPGRVPARLRGGKVMRKRLCPIVIALLSVLAGCVPGVAEYSKSEAPNQSAGRRRHP